MKQWIVVVECSALLSIFFSCSTVPPPTPAATVQTAQSGGCGSTHGAFVETGKMLTPRASHTATLLEDGSVLIVGGITGRPSVALNSSEIYDPAHGAFLDSGEMTVPRQQAVATRLSDGRVLIAGGSAKGPSRFYTALQQSVGSSEPLDSAEIYDPKSKTFSSVGSMGFTRIPQSATLLDGGKVLLFGFDSAEVFDPASGTFSTTAKPTATRIENAAVRLNDGRALIACGGISGSETWKSAEIYDPKSNRFARTGDMAEQLNWCHATLLSDGNVLLVGSTLTKKAEIYDPKTGTFSFAGEVLLELAEPLPSRLKDGRVLVTSYAFPGYPLRKGGLTAETYDPSSHAFNSMGEVQPERTGYTSTTLKDGSVLIAGGSSDYGPLYPSSALLFCP